MHIEVQQAGVGHATGPGQVGFKHRLRLKRGGILRDDVTGYIPHLPWRQVHQGFNKYVSDISVLGVILVNLSHRVGIGVVPAFHVLRDLALRIPGA